MIRSAFAALKEASDTNEPVRMLDLRCYGYFMDIVTYSDVSMEC